MSTFAMMRHPGAFLPLAMSAVALFAVLQQLVRFGTAPQADEGAAAHIWQLLMVIQLPIVAFFAVRWWDHAPRQTAIVVAIQLAAIVTAVLPVLLLGW